MLNCSVVRSYALQCCNGFRLHDRQGVLLCVTKKPLYLGEPYTNPNSALLKYLSRQLHSVSAFAVVGAAALASGLPAGAALALPFEAAFVFAFFGAITDNYCMRPIADLILA